MTRAPAPVQAGNAAVSPAAFLAALDDVLHEEARRNIREVPNIGALGDAAQEFDVGYYLRHRIETVRRIRLTARTDALALASMVDQHYEAARRWGDYTAEEMKHDRLFLADLARHGWTAERVLAVPPLPSTMVLVDYLARQVERAGGIAAVAYSIFVEWNSERFSRQAVERVEQALGPEYARGARAHLGIDEKEDHFQEMVDIAYLLAGDAHGLERLRGLLRDIASLLRDSFRELNEAALVMAPES